METIEKSIEVEQPIRSVYNQWTQFESFPLFMEGVKSVRQVTDKRLQWHVEIAGITKIWEADIVEQIPDSRIAWHSTSGAVNNGQVLFESLAPDRTLVTLILNYETEGALEKVGDALGLVSLRIQGDLRRFKDTIEKRTTPAQGWRGEIEDGQINPPD
ncbi:polyketide cyclase/dehydrase/lipid transport protein [Prosthecobacter fusiformis]|uniref:Polyketide cyclase/dehydrase/lipid transport protein n=1 Tax=Prosthecobacter fusiformis TaxID=48464 RepID=A0A4R7S1P6_9BACT|nr:SRPBCC family protein [Prosthecobacter fusiformis]TDU71338.1 polyketide cyclase/dehydrase/lipid transport protein [Prosthecobacter fusiformis]